MNRPNILYIHSHDTGRYIQPYGYPVATPALQSLAEQGILFRQAFSNASMCSPSRAGLLTGQCAHNNGMVGLAHRGFSLNDYRQHLIHTLGNAGYYSALIGVQHIADDPTVIGYDQLEVQRVVPEDSEPGLDSFLEGTPQAVDIVQAAQHFLQNPPQQPFFLSVGFFETHRPFPEPEGDPGLCQPPAPLPDTPKTRYDMAGFKASARVLDDSIGEILATLDIAGLAESTLVLYTSDHGLPFPGMKCTLTDHGIGVSLILRGPGGFEGGKVSDAMVTHLDIYPTLCELLDITPPPWLQGKSLLPLLHDDFDVLHDEIFAEINYHAAYEPQRAVRTTRWKYIRRFDGRTRPILSNIEDSPSKDVWLAYGWQDRPIPEELLYDLIFDPTEAHNLAGDEAHAEILTQMQRRLQRWMHETDDPLLRGPIVPPSGATFNDPDGMSPAEKMLVAP